MALSRSKSWSIDHGDGYGEPAAAGADAAGPGATRTPSTTAAAAASVQAPVQGVQEGVHVRARAGRPHAGARRHRRRAQR